MQETHRPRKGSSQWSRRAPDRQAGALELKALDIRGLGALQAQDLLSYDAQHLVGFRVQGC
jgi:hypothetical protein